MTVLTEAVESLRALRFLTGFAQSAQEVQETQALRYRVFAGELGAQIDGGADRLDADRYDRYCRHLMVRELETGRVIACTRILTDARAAETGGFYSASEFDLDMIHSLPGRVMEIGRTCVDPAFRSGTVIALLWQGIADYVTRNDYDYLFGCASIGMEDGGGAAHAILDTLRRKYMSPLWQRVQPLNPLPAADAPPAGPVRMPPLLKAYVNLGAKACGEPCWDPDFNCADVFMLLNVSELNPRYARHFFGRDAQRSAAAASA